MSWNSDNNGIVAVIVSMIIVGIISIYIPADAAPLPYVEIDYYCGQSDYKLIVNPDINGENMYWFLRLSKYGEIESTTPPEFTNRNIDTIIDDETFIFEAMAACERQ